MCFILYWIFFVFILIYAFSPKRTSGERWFSLGILLLSLAIEFTVGYGWVLVFIWGAICWGAYRAGET